MYLASSDRLAGGLRASVDMTRASRSAVNHSRFVLRSPLVTFRRLPRSITKHIALAGRRGALPMRPADDVSLDGGRALSLTRRAVSKGACRPYGADLLNLTGSLAARNTAPQNSDASTRSARRQARVLCFSCFPSPCPLVMRVGNSVASGHSPRPHPNRRTDAATCRPCAVQDIV